MAITPTTPTKPIYQSRTTWIVLVVSFLVLALRKLIPDFDWTPENIGIVKELLTAVTIVLVARGASFFKGKGLPLLGSFIAVVGLSGLLTAQFGCATAGNAMDYTLEDPPTVVTNEDGTTQLVPGSKEIIHIKIKALASAAKIAEAKGSTIMKWTTSDGDEISFTVTNEGKGLEAEQVYTQTIEGLSNALATVTTAGIFRNQNLPSGTQQLIDSILSNPESLKILIDAMQGVGFEVLNPAG